MTTGPFEGGDPALSVRNVMHRYGNRIVLHHISLDVAPGEWMVLLGESGSGKSTLLRIVAGLERPERGSIAMLGSDQSSVPAHRRPIAWMSQAAGCYEQLSVSENLSIAQRMVDSSAAITRENALAWREELVDGLKLGPLLDREPSSISGGERQRVALARSLLSMRPILLLDEPLAHLNESMRELVGGQLRRWTHRMGTSVLWVTHDSLEAAELADRMALMVDGGIEQVGAPKNIIADPASDRAAELVVRLRRFRSVHLGL